MWMNVAQTHSRQNQWPQRVKTRYHQLLQYANEILTKYSSQQIETRFAFLMSMGCDRTTSVCVKLELQDLCQMKETGMTMLLNRQ